MPVPGRPAGSQLRAARSDSSTGNVPRRWPEARLPIGVPAAAAAWAVSAVVSLGSVGDEARTHLHVQRRRSLTAVPSVPEAAFARDGPAGLGGTKRSEYK